MQKSVNRNVANKDLRLIDHALGHPAFPLQETYRNYFATSCKTDIEYFSVSDCWETNSRCDDMVFFCVTEKGRLKLHDYPWENRDIYGRAYEVTYKEYEGSTITTGLTRSKARYQSYLDADTDMNFKEYCSEIKSIRLVA